MHPFLKLFVMPLLAATALQTVAQTDPWQAGRTQVAAMSVDRLKVAYLECDRAATEHVLPPSVAQHCSIVGEELKQRHFGGDFGKLIEWWRAEKRKAEASARTDAPRDDELPPV